MHIFNKKSYSSNRRKEILILIIRFSLGFCFIRYGYGKLQYEQFGITKSETLTSIKGLDLFRVSWYVFGHEPFNSFIGGIQIICGILLIINRTSVIGAILFIPITVTILIIDITYMPPQLSLQFIWRLSIYLILNLFVLLHHREKIILMWRILWKKASMKYVFPLWYYLALPFIAVILDMVIFIPMIIINYINNPDKFQKVLIVFFTQIIESIQSLLNH